MQVCPGHWWEQRAALQGFIADLLASELAALRRDMLLPAHTWTEATSLQHDLGMDSLEFLHVAGLLADSLQLRRSGVEDYLLARRTLGDWIDIASAGLQHWCEELTFLTSGSSGAPKSCVHALAALEQEAQALAALFPGRQRILLAVPSHHIYGFLCGQLLPRWLGMAPGQVISIRSKLPSRLASEARAGDLVVGHPQFWQAALTPGQVFPAGVIGVSSTAPCPDAVAMRADGAGLQSLVQLYGASETGGLGWRASWRDDYALHPYLEHDAAQGAIVRHGADGQPAALAAQDELAWTGARSFQVGKRCDGAVQVGGINVFPERVRQVLLSHPAVADAAVRLMRAEEGGRLKAYIVPAAQEDDAASFIHTLRRWMDEALTAPERPKAIALGPSLPRGPMGKLIDWDAGA